MKYNVVKFDSVNFITFKTAQCWMSDTVIFSPSTFLNWQWMNRISGHENFLFNIDFKRTCMARKIHHHTANKIGGKITAFWRVTLWDTEAFCIGTLTAIFITTAGYPCIQNESCRKSSGFLKLLVIILDADSLSTFGKHKLTHDKLFFWFFIYWPSLMP